jgi:2-keto-3-deoxy-L-rhamnonate aldolase RhmA
MPLSFRARLRSRERLVGTMVTINAPSVAELLAEVGFDWLFVDAEHGSFDTSEMQVLMQAAGATPCLVRLPEADETSVKKALDIGAAGIIAPQIDSAERARRIVRAAKYAPAGERGLGIARAQRYGLKLRECLQTANDDTAVVIQAERREAVDEIREIVRIEGVDAVLIGPYDLSASLGHPGAIDHPDVRAAIARVRGACLEAGVAVGIFGLSAEAVRPWIEQGFTLIVAGVDTMLLSGAAGSLLSAVRSV